MLSVGQRLIGIVTVWKKACCCVSCFDTYVARDTCV